MLHFQITSLCKNEGDSVLTHIQFKAVSGSSENSEIFLQKSVFFSKMRSFFLKMSILSQIGELFANLREKIAPFEKKVPNFEEKGQICSHDFSQCR